MLYLSEWAIVVFGGGAACEHAISDKKNWKWPAAVITLCLMSASSATTHYARWALHFDVFKILWLLQQTFLVVGVTALLRLLDALGTC